MFKYLRIFSINCLLLNTASGLATELQFVTAQTAVQAVKLTGFTRARHHLPLTTEVAGKVDQVFIDIGDTVTGQGKIACLDQTFVKLEIQANQAELKRLMAEANYFRKQVERHSQLVKQQNSAQMNLDGVQRSLASSQAYIEAQRVENRRLLEKQRRHCITAPTGWQLTARSIEPGQWLDVGARLGTAGDFTRLLVPFALSMQEYRAVQQANKPLRLHMTNLNVTVPARLIRVSPAFDEETRKITLDLEISTGLEQYRGGLQAELTVQLPLQSGSVLVSEKALQQRYEDYWLQRENGQNIRVIYQGRSGLLSNEGSALIRIAAPDIQVGDRFRIYEQ